MQTETEAPVTGASSYFWNVTRRYAASHGARGRRPAGRGGTRWWPSSGPSGCGKSTLLELIAGPPGARRGHGGRRRDARCAYMPQRDLLLPWRDALANAALALECQGVPRSEARRRAEPLFERFGLAEFERARPAELSGGMRQRVAFLRTLLPGPRRCCCSTSRSGRSTRSRARRCSAGSRTRSREEPRTVLLVTHDVEEAVFLADRVVGALAAARPRGGGDRGGRCRGRAT